MDYQKIIAEKDARIKELEKIAQRVDSLTHLLAEAMYRIRELESQLNQNSRNSSKPPSSDINKRKPSLPGKKGKKGGQKGHKGDPLKMSSEVDDLQLCAPKRCMCGKRLLRQAMAIHARRQVFDIPDPKLLVTEYQQLSCTCPNCGQLNLGQFPDQVKASVQYGDGVQALVSLLHVKCQLSYQNISELFTDLLGQPINGATLQQAVQKSYNKLEGVEQQIKDKLLCAAVLHTDETGLRIDGKRRWVHVACNEAFTYLYVHNSRGKKAIQEGMGDMFDYIGTLIHDCFGSYWGLGKARHGLCGAHLLRELTGLVENGSSWAGQMHTLLLELFQDKQAGRSFTSRHKAWRTYDKICRLADQQEPPPIPQSRGKSKKTKGRNLAERLIKYKIEVLRFALEPSIPFSNNQAERDLRPVKGKQKVAGCFRTFDGARRYARLQEVFSSWRKQGYSIFAELKAILNGNTFAFAD